MVGLTYDPPGKKDVVMYCPICRADTPRAPYDYVDARSGGPTAITVCKWCGVVFDLTYHGAADRREHSKGA